MIASGCEIRARWLGVPRATLEGLISAIIKDSERKAREDKAEARRQEERIRCEQEREQRERKRERLISLPSEQHEAKLAELAKRLDEDLAAVRNEFSAFVGMAREAASTDFWNVKPWPEPVRTRLLLKPEETQFFGSSQCMTRLTDEL